MKLRLIPVISALLMAAFLFQNCAQVGQPVAFINGGDSKTSHASDQVGGNGGGYEGKLTFLQVEAGFTCENKPAPKSILRRDENKIWYLTVNEKALCGMIRGQIVSDVDYTPGSHQLLYHGAMYILDNAAPWDKDSTLSDYLREFKVTPASDNNAKDVAPGDGVCADVNGQCTLQAAAEEANAKPDLGVVILVSAGRYDLTQEIKIQSKALSWVKGDNKSTTILSGTNLTRIFSSQQATLKLSDLTLTESRSEVGTGTGGGLYSVNSHIFIDSLNFINNYATSYGAGLTAIGGNLYIRRTVFDSNRLSPTPGLLFGDAVYSGSNFEFKIEESTFVHHNNSASTRGVIYSFQDSNFLLRDSLLYDSTISGPALALVATTEKALIEDSTIAGSNGDGLYVFNRAAHPVHEMTIRSSAFLDNRKSSPDSSGNIAISWQDATGTSNSLQIVDSYFGRTNQVLPCTMTSLALLPPSTNVILKNNTDYSRGCEGLNDPTTNFADTGIHSRRGWSFHFSQTSLYAFPP